jgi:type IV pilus assembly protein PilQ
LTETEEKIEEFKRLVAQIDIPIRQVLIEARLVTASTDIVRDLGVEWTAGYIDNGDDSSAFVGGNVNDDIDLNNGLLTGDFGSVDLGAVSATSDIAFGYVTDNFLVELELSALESEGYGEIISQPKVVTGDQQTAVIRSGSEIPFQQASASGATTTAYRDATLSLEVTPQITPDDHIILNLTVNQDAIGEVVAFGANSAPTIDVTEVDTQVLVKNGETIVLGGIFQSNETFAELKVPLLGDIPLVGNFFKRTTRDTEKTELLIFITPRLLEDPVRRQ